MLILDLTVRLRIAYSVRKFPKYDDMLNQSNIKALKAISIVYCITGARLYSNQQVF